MRLFRLLTVAAQAESLHLRRRAAGLVRSAAFIATAAVFCLAALIGAHVALAAWLTDWYGLAVASGIVAGGDVLVAVALVLLARRDDPVADEALQLRRKVLTAAGNSMGFQDRTLPTANRDPAWAAAARVAARAWVQWRRR